MTTPSAELHSEPTAEQPPATRRARLFVWMTRARFALYTFVLLGLLVIGYLWPRIFVIISAGLGRRVVPDAGGWHGDRSNVERRAAHHPALGQDVYL